MLAGDTWERLCWYMITVWISRTLWYREVSKKGVIDVSVEWLLRSISSGYDIAMA